ncbi:MBL fold metallo-hydrolase [Bradyrhizobium japonicum]|uniref:Glyoxylase-like metal-dependent hydrolase (Beta-lactamase superfamily II) n=1 Tax=Bradyrhizobium japonicum TaxID=375 RepID=A0ABV2S1H7_BRAJP|nr:MBL fold metallo-hydrolase [Bradyrhizobium japonicum]MCP1767386.1 glyoxylase-like metal-dependent hydrolase (beta-lactamase superfamily II) [Bradyrhizobium japonicum]MCP1789525.1 glyoxylase-like metal-dependent hydrolase (beta-lactamase superfamily II) [Bradyrhizobium japonicum]MCP1802024.1 glyoxylase-like metal-dependent hydrolase (beta-lactamase superfamily II) [Bradyrhizobium japonicum]MCP1820334.1 glyoxylase-like metal-dependent hydrolase (beta-lactamase superfamily II) [Bradyrhizobium j
MSMIETTSTILDWDVTTVKRAGLSRDLPSGNPDLMWVANSSTLIHGERDAILVDTFLTAGQSKTLRDWVVSRERNLTTIYVTHGHGDHFFGLAPLLDCFPQAKAVAVPEVVDEMKTQLSPASLDGFWRKRFPGEIAQRLVAAEPLEGELTLEGHELVVIDMGRTDTARSTALHVPSLDLIVAGDTVYNGVHPYLAETDTQSRLEWIAALDRLEALKPRFVVAGHKKPENDDDPRSIADTRQYLLDFNRLDQATISPRELYEAMLALHPDRANPGSLWRGANAAKGPGS